MSTRDMTALVERAQAIVSDAERVTQAHLRTVTLPGATIGLITLDNGEDHTKPNTFGPASLLALKIRTDLEFDYLHATRYRGKTRGAGLTWLRHPQVPMLGRRVLLVDDILDEGHTLLAVRDACIREGAAEVRIAVLTRKLHDRVVPDITADYVGLEVPDRYVFGFGMDFHEQGRNLPGIYAL